ncbi:MAG: hypothetical protein J4G13_13515 [Dehalococcoidia bacterium]|nr:hypothetical protein [Dehalococcoidia bacterium]
MFWALAQWQKDKDAAAKARREMRAKAWAKGCYRQGIMNIWNEAQSANEREFIRRWAEERGITLPTGQASDATII